MAKHEYGNGVTYTGECMCHGVIVSGRIARARPLPYKASVDPFGEQQVRALFILDDHHQAHDVPLKGIEVVP